MGNAFTPGPWRTFLDESQVGDANAEGICAMWRINRDASDEGRANARLIAAAPTMFEALKQAQVLLDELTHPNTSNVSISSQVYFARCVATEAKARTILAFLEPYGLKPGEKK